MVSLVNPYVAVLDACVLAPMPVSDTLLRLAEEPAFYIPKWSADILLEVRSTMQKLGRTPEQIDRRITAMEAAFEDACVSGYEALVPSMTNHAKDRHVLAAAVCARAHVIVTDNVRDFPKASLLPYGVEAQTTDEFLSHQYHLSPDLFLEVLQAQADDIRRSLPDLLKLLAIRAPRLLSLINAG